MAHTTARRPISTHARAAKEIRRKLRAMYPHTTFRVRSESFAGGDAVDITWTDGPTTHEVEALADWHEYGRFDGMRDIYEATKTHPNIPQVKYVQCHRSMSPEAGAGIAASVIAEYGSEAAANEHMRDIHIMGRTHRIFSARSFVCETCAHPAEWADRSCAECGAASSQREALGAWFPHLRA